MPSTRPLRPLLLLLLAATVTVALSSSARALSLPAETTALLSGAPDLLTPLPTPVADATSGAQAVDRTGRYVVFSSEADGLFDGDDDSVRNVYLKRMATGEIELLSRDSSGQPSHGDCDEPAIAPDAVAIAFTCDGPLDPADTNGASDVYACPIGCGPGIGSRLVSANDSGAVGDGASRHPAVSAGGRYVAFSSRARNLDAVVSGASVYRRELGFGDGTLAVSIADGARSQSSQAAADAEGISISADGDVVAFDTAAPLDAAADRNNVRDIYARRVTSGRTALVSRVGTAGAAGDDSSRDPRIDADGDVVAFESTATTLSGADTRPDLDVYRRNLTAGTTTVVSAGGAGKANADSVVAGISADGAAVAFLTAATNLDPDDSAPDGADVYVARPGGTVLASRADGAAGAPAEDARSAALSGDGAKVAATLGGLRGTAPSRVELRDLDAATTRLASRPPGAEPFVNAGGDAGDGAVSADGRYVAFVATAPALGVDPAGDGAVVVRDTETGAATVASRGDGPAGAPLPGSPRQVRITPDGRYVVFTLSPGGRVALAPSFDTVWRRDLRDSRTELVSRADGADGAPANAYAEDPSISDDGSRVAFVTSATNLGDGDPTGDVDVHVRDLAAGRTLLASRRDGSDPVAAASGDAFYGAISGDGRSVGFSSFERDLADGDRDGEEDVFVRRLDAGVTTLVGVADDGRKADRGARFAAIDRDGDRIALASDARTFPVPEREEIYVRDLAAARLLLVSRGDGADGAAADGRIGQARLSADGERVAFEASSSMPLAPVAPTDEGQRVYLRELTAGRTSLLSRASGSAGAAPAFAQLGGIAAGGGCVAFAARPRALGAAASDDYWQQFVRVVDDRCGAAAPSDGGDDGGGGSGEAPRGTTMAAARAAAEPAPATAPPRA